MNHNKYIRFYKKKFRPKMMINKVRNENFTQPMRQHTLDTHARMYIQDIKFPNNTAFCAIFLVKKYGFVLHIAELKQSNSKVPYW
jgi:hypothetical protein